MADNRRVSIFIDMDTEGARRGSGQVKEYLDEIAASARRSGQGIQDATQKVDGFSGSLQGVAGSFAAFSTVTGMIEGWNKVLFDSLQTAKQYAEETIRMRDSLRELAGIQYKLADQPFLQQNIGLVRETGRTAPEIARYLTELQNASAASVMSGGGMDQQQMDELSKDFLKFATAREIPGLELNRVGRAVGVTASRFPEFKDKGPQAAFDVLAQSLDILNVAPGQLPRNLDNWSQLYADYGDTDPALGKTTSLTEMAAMTALAAFKNPTAEKWTINQTVRGLYNMRSEEVAGIKSSDSLSEALIKMGQYVSQQVKDTGMEADDVLKEMGIKHQAVRNSLMAMTKQLDEPTAQQILKMSREDSKAYGDRAREYTQDYFEKGGAGRVAEGNLRSARLERGEEGLNLDEIRKLAEGDLIRSKAIDKDAPGWGEWLVETLPGWMGGGMARHRQTLIDIRGGEILSERARAAGISSFTLPSSGTEWPINQLPNALGGFIGGNNEGERIAIVNALTAEIKKLNDNMQAQNKLQEKANGKVPDALPAGPRNTSSSSW